jgi:hypothetical protein
MDQKKPSLLTGGRALDGSLIFFFVSRKCAMNRLPRSDWHASLIVLIGVSMLLQSVQSNISVHFSVKWDWKTKDSIAKQETKVQKK